MLPVFTGCCFNSTMTYVTGYGYGTIANVLCCLCSLGAVLILPCTSKTVYRILMAVFVGLGVSTLASDSLLHLLPMVSFILTIFLKIVQKQFQRQKIEN